MILSRTLAKSRIERSYRPTWFEAWCPVVFDFAIYCLYATLVLAELLPRLRSEQSSDAVTVLLFLALLFIPLQVTMILSSLWASKSRWLEKDTTE
jgi:hypothetical protein